MSEAELEKMLDEAVNEEFEYVLTVDSDSGKSVRSILAFSRKLQQWAVIELMPQTMRVFSSKAVAIAHFSEWLVAEDQLTVQPRGLTAEWATHLKILLDDPAISNN